MATRTTSSVALVRSLTDWIRKLVDETRGSSSSASKSMDLRVAVRSACQLRGPAERARTHAPPEELGGVVAPQHQVALADAQVVQRAVEQQRVDARLHADPQLADRHP